MGEAVGSEQHEKCPQPGHIDVERGVSAALERVQRRPERNPETGQFVVGNAAAGTTLARSEAFWSDVQVLKAELVERTGTALGVDADTPETLLGLLGAYAESRLFRQAMFHRLVDQGGPITSKGRARALYTAYLSALDRETRLAGVLGLERRQKAVATLADVLEQHEDGAPTKASAWPVMQEPEQEHDERRLGELMQAQRETLGLATAGRKRIGFEENPISDRPTLAEAGIDKNLADRARKIVPLEDVLRDNEPDAVPAPAAEEPTYAPTPSRPVNGQWTE